MNKQQQRLDQQGYSTLLMVMVIFCLSIVQLTALERYLSIGFRQLKEHIAYYQQYQLAASSLQWGLQQHWSRPVKDWYCLHDASLKLMACIKALNRSDLVLLRGQTVKITHYWLVKFDEQKTGANLVAQSGQWLDFCPQKKTEC